MSKPNGSLPKIARAIARLNIGGPARQACFLHERLKSRYDTLLITGALDAGEGDMSYLLANDDRVRMLGAMSRPLKLWSDAISLVQLVGILRKERPAILHTHTAKAGAIGRVAALIVRTPIRVHTYHGHIFHGYFSPTMTKVFILIERILNRFTHRVIAISESQATDLAEVYCVVKREKLMVIRAGHDLSPFKIQPSIASVRKELGLPIDKIVVAWAGRMVPIKNVGLLADIVKLAHASVPNLYFVIVGDGPDRAGLQAALGGMTNVSFLGWRTEMSDIWHAADVALGTSLNEGTPAALIEAMAAGKPFVATNVGGLIDLAVDPEPSGDVVNAKNCVLARACPHTITECLKSLANNPTLRTQMGIAGRNFAFAHHDREALAQRVADLYDQLIQAHCALKAD